MMKFPAAMNGQYGACSYQSFCNRFLRMRNNSLN
jgi:hypothetical protein